MKCKKVEKNQSQTYPTLDTFEKSSILQTLVVGASITVSLALLACQSKEAESEPPTLPRKEVVSVTDNGHKPEIPASLKESHSTKVKTNEKMRLLGGRRAPRRPKKDSDGDGVADAQDRCPKRPGLAKYRGCPTPRKLRGRMIRPRRP